MVSLPNGLILTVLNKGLTKDFKHVSMNTLISAIREQ